MKFLDLTGLQHFYDKYLRPLKDAAFKTVANDLATEKEGSVLDARQGKALNDLKLNIAKVINNLLTTEEGFALDARQGKVLDDKITELNGKLKVYETNNNGGWTVVKHPNRWTELHITAMIPRASTEAYSLPLNFPDEIRLRNAQTIITPARNGWNVANYYHNNDSQDSETMPIDHTNLVFSAKTTQSLTYYFEVMVCGFEH